MKETIYSIPINEAFELVDGTCPICRLHNRLIEDTVEYTLGAAMMEPDVRIRTNEQGFCPEHLGLLLVKQKRLPLSLVLQTHLEEMQRNKKVFFNASSCYVCNRTDGFLQAYYGNILYLWKTDAGFLPKWTAQKNLCRPHMAGLAAAAPGTLSKKEVPVFIDGLFAKAKEQMEGLSESLAVFVKSFDHRFAGQPLGEHKEAVQKTAVFLSGREPV